eukprot:373272-Pyramimonas_sp.AAC.1
MNSVVDPLFDYSVPGPLVGSSCGDEEPPGGLSSRGPVRPKRLALERAGRDLEAAVRPACKT